MSSSNGAPAASPAKNWVHFDEEGGDGAEKATPAVISAENVQVNGPQQESTAVAVREPLRTVELPVAVVEPVRQGFGEWKSGCAGGNVSFGVCCSERRYYRDAAAGEHKVSVDHAGEVSARVGAGGAHGAGFDGEV